MYEVSCKTVHGAEVYFQTDNLDYAIKVLPKGFNNVRIADTKIGKMIFEYYESPTTYTALLDASSCLGCFKEFRNNEEED